MPQAIRVIDESEINSAVSAHNSLPTAHGLTTNISAALSGAASPSASNVFATMADAGGGPSLSDYANVIVVDAGGSGDCTTLAEAMAIITDASASKVYEVWLFGKIVGSTTTCKDFVNIVGSVGHSLDLQGTPLALATALYRNLNLVSGTISLTTTSPVVQDSNLTAVNAIYLAGNGTATFINCSLNIISTTASGGTLILKNCDIAGNITYSHAATIKIYSSRLVTSLATSINVVSNTGFNTTLELYDSQINNTNAAGVGISMVVIGGTHVVRIANCYVSATGAGASRGLTCFNFGATLNFYAAHSTFIGTAGAEAVSIPWANAPFYQCAFGGGVINMTANAGTAVGTCVSF